MLDTRALAYIALGRGEAALRDLDEAVSADPAPTTIFHLALAQLLAERREEARASLRRAKEAGLAEAAVDPLERDTYRRLAAALER